MLLIWVPASPVNPVMCALACAHSSHAVAGPAAAEDGHGPAEQGSGHQTAPGHHGAPGITDADGCVLAQLLGMTLMQPAPLRAPAVDAPVLAFAFAAPTTMSALPLPVATPPPLA